MERRFSPFISSVFLLLVGLLLGALTIVALSASSLYEFHETIRLDGVLPKTDAIVVLAGGRKRIRLAGRLWYRYVQEQKIPVPLLYISGTGPYFDRDAIVDRLEPAVEEALEERNLVIERESENTLENAEWAAQMAQELNWSAIVLITSSYHMKRARYVFERVMEKRLGRSLRIDTLAVNQSPFSAEEWQHTWKGIHVTLLEYFKWVFYRTVL